VNILFVTDGEEVRVSGVSWSWILDWKESEMHLERPFGYLDTPEMLEIRQEGPEPRP
jgi:hypothetical protein